MNTIIQFRRGTAAEWIAVNPTLAAGEVGFETDTGKMKVGTGSTTWNSLPYTSLGPTGPTGSIGPTGPISYSSIVTQSGTAYTLQVSDVGKLISTTSSSDVTVTVPPFSSETFLVGQSVEIVQSGTGQVIVQGDTGVTVNTSSQPKTRDQYSVISVINTAQDVWLVVGDMAIV